MRLEHEVVVAEVDGVTAQAGNHIRISIRGVKLPEGLATSQQIAEFVVPALAGIESAGRHNIPPKAGTTNARTKSQNQPSCFELTSEDTVLIRTNPGRDPARHAIHHTFLELMMIAETSGVRIINSPAHLTRFASKSSLLLLDPNHRPEMLVSPSHEVLTDFVQSAPGDCVVKPVFGSRGKNVLRVSSDQQDLVSLLAATFHDEPIVAQHFVTANHLGDRRVVVLDGKILESDGKIAGIERRPAAGDFRANLHAGATPHPLNLNELEREAATHAAKLLSDHGIRLAGVDMIGDKIIEFNVFSTGGLFDGNRFANTDFTSIIIERLLA